MKVRLGLAAAIAAMLAFAVSQLSLRTDVTRFLPEETAGSAGTLTRVLAGAELTRGMVLSLGAPDPVRARAAARELADALRTHPEVVWARVGPDPELVRDLHALYFPRRLGFLTDAPEDPDQGLTALTSAPRLRERARRLRSRLSLPGGSALAALAAQDPLGAFERIIARVRATDPGLRIEADQFVSVDGRFALILLQTLPPAFDTARQAPLLESIDEMFAGLRDRHPKDDLVLEASGINRFATRIEQEIRRDALRIGLVSLVGLAVLFLVFFRSPAAFGLAILPPLLGILVAVCLGILVQGDLDVLTLAFGASLTGVAIDYAIHLVNHHAFAVGGVTARETARRLRPTLGLGALTTMASFAGLALTDFPGFREMGLFSVTGVAVALVVTLWVLPSLLRREWKAGVAAAYVAHGLARGAEGLRRHRPVLVVALGLSLVVVAIGLPQLHWSNDLRGLSQLDPELLEEDQRVRGRLSQFDTSRLVVVRAPDEATALARSHQLHARLEQARSRGVLEGTRSLHALLWPAELQRRNQEALRSDPGLVERLSRIFSEEGFREDAFDSFVAELERDPPGPLTLAELSASSLAPLVDSLVVYAGDELILVTYLRGVRSEDELAAALADIPGASLFDHTALIDGLFGEFRATTLRQMAVGSLLVVLVLALRYRRWRPTLAAFLPSVMAALLLLSVLGLLGMPANLLHAVSLLLVMGMGVDYGIFMVDAARDRASLGATLSSLLLSCLTTVLVFGTLALSSHPALRAIGVTTGLGVALSFLLAPMTWAVLAAPDGSPRDG